uniref:N-acyl-aromatic-L-amino acid amidohydrolase (carboxylate-forming) A-like n=1 Tax=Sinocyclocheilus anshuiensis TaxID=1608454 RepID=A0A671RYM0_9TELE
MLIDVNLISPLSRSSPITDSSPYEVRRAQELNNLLGPKGSTDAIDLICDLHNTTANMGLTLIHYTTSDWVTLARTSQTKITKVPVRVLVLDFPISDAYNFESVSRHGFSIEVGPQPHGVVRADIYIIMKEAVDLTIDWIHKFNSGTVFEGGDVEAFKFIKSVDYPRDPETRTLTSAIHPQLQDRDFCLLMRGDPLFFTFSRETVKPLYDCEHTHTQTHTHTHTHKNTHSNAIKHKYPCTQCNTHTLIHAYTFI